MDVASHEEWPVERLAGVSGVSHRGVGHRHRFPDDDASFRDPSGNGWKMIEARKAPSLTALLRDEHADLSRRDARR
jgi:hypothetical protein